MRAELLSQRHRETRIDDDAHAGLVGIVAADLLLALLGGVEVALGFVRPDGDDDLIEEVEAAADDIGMTPREGVEGASVEGYALHRTRRGRDLCVGR